MYIPTHVGYEKGLILENTHMLQSEIFQKGEAMIPRRKGDNATNVMQDYFSTSNKPITAAEKKMGRCDCLDLGSWEQGLETISV